MAGGQKVSLGAMPPSNLPMKDWLSCYDKYTSSPAPVALIKLVVNNFGTYKSIYWF